VPLATTFVSGSGLSALVDDTLVASPAWVSITVQTAGPGGGTSAPLAFGIDNVPASLTEYSPITGTVYSDYILTVTGTQVVTGTLIQWMGTTLTTTVGVQANVVQVSVPQALYPVGGVYTFTLVSPEPPTGGVTATNSLSVTMYNPIPIIRAVSPVARLAGTVAFTLTVNANVGEPNYLDGIQGYFNGQPRTTTFISSTRVVLDILQSDVAVVGTQAITLTNPSPDIAPSEVFDFLVISPTLALTPTTQAVITLPTNGTLWVNVGQTLANPTVITLTSSNPQIAQVPPTVTDPVGSLGASFTVTGSLTGTVVITAQMPLPLGGRLVTATVRFQDQDISGLNALADDPTTLGQVTTLSATITAGTNVSYSWAFGDGSTSAFTTTSLITHTYAFTPTGTFTPTVTARNTADTDMDTTVVTINNPVPVILTMSPLTPTQDITQTITVTGTAGTFVTGALAEIRTSADVVVVTYTTIVTSGVRLTFQMSGATFTSAGAFRLYIINPAPPVAIASRKSAFFAFNIQ
jgi:hypothetical protein